VIYIIVLSVIGHDKYVYLNYGTIYYIDENNNKFVINVRIDQPISICTNIN